MLLSESEASPVSVVGIGVGAGGIGARSEVGAMRIRHVGEKFNWIGVESGWVILRATELGGMVGDFFSGTLPHPQKSTPKRRHPKHWEGRVSVPRYFKLYQGVEGRPSLLEVCIGAIRPNAFNQVRVHHIRCIDKCICAEIRVGIDNSG